MAEIKMNKRGQITIPKEIRDTYGWFSNITLEIKEDERKIILVPAIVCHRCGKPLSDKFRKTGTCPDCPPPKIITVY